MRISSVLKRKGSKFLWLILLLLPVLVTACDDLSLFALATEGVGSGNLADLSSLTISGGTLSPTFRSTIKDYTVVMPYGAYSITIIPTTITTSATIDMELHGTKFANLMESGESASTPTLTAGDLIKIIVSASEDGQPVVTSTYNISVYIEPLG